MQTHGSSCIPLAESKFTSEIAARARTLGFKVWPLNQTRRQPRQHVEPGVADLVMFGHKVTLWVETKVDRNSQSVPQQEFEMSATANGSLYWVIRSMDEFMLMGKLQRWWR